MRPHDTPAIAPDPAHGEPVIDLAVVDRLVAEKGSDPSSVIPLLQAIQEQFRYLPRAALKRVCETTRITPAAMAGVSTFYSQFRHRPVGKHIISICHGTACHVKGSELIQDALVRHLKIVPGEDTDPAGLFTLERVACLGCCTLAPVIKIDGVTYGHLTSETVPQALADFLELARQRRAPDAMPVPGVVGKECVEFRIGVGSCCVAGGSDEVKRELLREVGRRGAPAVVKPVGCVGMCHQTPLVQVVAPGAEPVTYSRVQAGQAARIVRRHLRPKGVVRRMGQALDSALEYLLTDEVWEPVSRYALDVRDTPVCAFLDRQQRIASEECGTLDPLDGGEYEASGGWKALKLTLGRRDPGEIVEEITRSGLRGRGGAGFPTGRKWAAVRTAPGSPRYLVCNGDEGDPGAFMDRMLLESFPYRVLEGMVIAAYAMGVHEGFLYIRTEYPLALTRIRAALRVMQDSGYLGKDIAGSGFDLTLQVVEGAGAFVSGEETALLASLEGRRAEPSFRPPYPAECGLWGKPTAVNNVETLALVPWIIRNGASAFARFGEGESRGTKVFSLAGKIRRGGLIEVPMGMSVREIVDGIGGGTPDSRGFKAVQIGGPSGGCLPERLGETPVTYESLKEAGCIMGSGGLVVLDHSDCMVDLARYFMAFTQQESCGKCSPCRIGTKRMLEILERLCRGQGRHGDIERLVELGETTRSGSLCGLGRTAPHPVLSSIRHFREEYEAHVEGRCPALKCRDLVTYRINEACIGCTRCAQVCPADAIPVTPYERHAIAVERCTRCDACRVACPVQAVEKVARS